MSMNICPWPLDYEKPFFFIFALGFLLAYRGSVDFHHHKKAMGTYSHHVLLKYIQRAHN